MLASLSVWTEVQTCIWPSWCHCHSLSLASVKSRLVLPFWYLITRAVSDMGAVKRVCVCVCVCVCMCVYLTSVATGYIAALWARDVSQEQQDTCLAGAFTVQQKWNVERRIDNQWPTVNSCRLSEKLCLTLADSRLQYEVVWLTHLQRPVNKHRSTVRRWWRHSWFSSQLNLYRWHSAAVTTTTTSGRFKLEGLVGHWPRAPPLICWF